MMPLSPSPASLRRGAYGAASRTSFRCGLLPSGLARPARALCALVGAGLLGACAADGTSGPDTASTSAPAEAQTAPTPGPLTLPEPEGAPSAPGASGGTGAGTEQRPLTPEEEAALADVPEIYMALQPESGGTVSVIFAIDNSRDNTPSDDPAIRLTPEDGDCNPQELRRYIFPDRYAARPTFSASDARAGVPAEQLPAFLAIAVSNEMLDQGLADVPEDTSPQNICTRKLWERLVLSDAQRQSQAAGQ